MNSEEPSPLRIGHAERTAAQKALDEHLAEGRLSIDEYADRSAIAANAVVAPDLAALFTDLPQPHPDLPGEPATPQPTAAPAPSTGGPPASTGSGMMGLAVVAAIVLFVLTRQAGVFLLIPLAAGLMWYSRRS